MGAQTAQEDLEQLAMVLDIPSGSWSFKESLPTCVAPTKSGCTVCTVVSHMYIWLNHMLTLHVVTAADEHLEGLE